MLLFLFPSPRKLRALRRCPLFSWFGRETCHRCTIGIHQGVCENRHVVPGQDRFAHTVHHDHHIRAAVRVRTVRSRPKTRSTRSTRCRSCKQKVQPVSDRHTSRDVQADLGRLTSLDYTPFVPALETAESCVQANEIPDWQFKVKRGARHTVAACCDNHTETKADVDEQVLLHAKRGISGLTLHAGFGVSPGGIIPYRGFRIDAGDFDHRSPRCNCEGNVS